MIGDNVDQLPPPDAPGGREAEVHSELAGAVRGTGFTLLKRWFGSSVERRSGFSEVSVHGTGDVVDGTGTRQHLLALHACA